MPDAPVALIYAAIASLDLYVNDVDGNFDWAAPDEEVHAFVNDLERPVGTYLYGRRMYEIMTYWQSAPDDETENPVSRDYARLWRAADKVVYSSTLQSTSTPRTRLEARFDPAAVKNLKASSSKPIGIGGASLAGSAIAAGLVDEIHLILAPTIVGGGTRALPDGVRATLELLDERRFASGFVWLRYRVSRAS
jgi:dihydrofolate reductase